MKNMGRMERMERAGLPPEQQVAGSNPARRTISFDGFRNHDQMRRAGNVFRFGECRTCTLLRRPCRKARSEVSPALPAIQSLALNKEQISFPRGRIEFASGVSVGGSGQRA